LFTSSIPTTRGAVLSSVQWRHCTSCIRWTTDKWHICDTDRNVRHLLFTSDVIS